MNEYLQFAQDLADRAGAIMLEHFQVGVPSQAKPEAGDSPVTIADTQINRLVIEAVQAAYPGQAVIGEEESHRVEGSELTWVCDPIDGTMPYTMGIPVNVFSLALVNKDGEPVVAVVFDPYMKRKYWAVKGEGAYLNGQPIHVNAVSNLKQAYIGASMGATASVVRPQELRNDITARCYRTLVFRCSIYQSMLVASGQIAAEIYTSVYAHDAATAALIVTEAGGRVTNLFGGTQRYDQPIRGVIVSNGAIHDEIVAIAKQYRA
jgi:fructose-1,6-bisphosphatase/inositol monophosphatase family enzyme